MQSMNIEEEANNYPECIVERVWLSREYKSLKCGPNTMWFPYMKGNGNMIKKYINKTQQCLRNNRFIPVCVLRI